MTETTKCGMKIEKEEEKKRIIGMVTRMLDLSIVTARHLLQLSGKDSDCTLIGC